MKAKFQSGFTLIELMIAVAVIGILASIALPSYKQYVVRGNRAAAQAEMMDIANREQQYLLVNRGYTSSLSTLGYSAPAAISTKYTSIVTLGSFLDASCSAVADTGTAPSYVIAFAPISTGPQASDGTLYLSSTGVKCPSGKW